MQVDKATIRTAIPSDWKEVILQQDSFGAMAADDELFPKPKGLKHMSLNEVQSGQSIPMQSGLPLTGRFLVKQWAELLGIEVKTLTENMSDRGIRVIRFGRVSVVDVAWFWEDLMKGK